MPKRFPNHLRHNAVAYLALFLALGGTAIAAKPLVTGADIQDGSLTGTDVSDNSTLTGVDIDESDLGQVPSALNADIAANADKLDGKDASELGGEEPCRSNLSLEAADETEKQTVCTVSMLELVASCTNRANDYTYAELLVKNNKPGPGFSGDSFWGATLDGFPGDHSDHFGNVNPVTVVDADTRFALALPISTAGSFYAREGDDAVAGVAGIRAEANSLSGRCSFVIRGSD
jgi:hypothetical protein